MAQLVKLQDSWSRGTKQDISRLDMPDGSAWSLVDYIPDHLQAALAKRGGWAYAGPAPGGQNYIAGLINAPFAAAAKLFFITDSGNAYTVTSSSTASNLGAAVTVIQNPVFHRTRLIIPASGGATAPQSYDSSTLGALAGSPPTGKFAAVYKDRTLLANTTAQPTYIYFSAAGDPTTWDTTNGWLSVSRPVTGLAALPGAVLVFQDERTSRIRGSTPPPQTDMIVDDPIFGIGCTDARSIAVKGGIVCFANPDGVYLSNGTNLPTDLTSLAGAKKLWQTTLSGYAASTWSLAGGFYRDNYVITVMNAGSFKDCFVFDLTDFDWWRAANLTATCYANSLAAPPPHLTNPGEELYMGLRDESRVGLLSSMWSPSATYKNDGDGTAVVPVLETAFYGARPPGKKTWRSVYLEYEMTDAATDDPILTVSYLKNPNDAYTALTTTLAETGRTRKRLALRVPSDGLAFKIAQTNASANTFIHALQADVHGREPSRLT